MTLWMHDDKIELEINKQINNHIQHKMAGQVYLQ